MNPSGYVGYSVFLMPWYINAKSTASLRLCTICHDFIWSAMRHILCERYVEYFLCFDVRRNNVCTSNSLILRQHIIAISCFVLQSFCSTITNTNTSIENEQIRYWPKRIFWFDFFVISLDFNALDNNHWFSMEINSSFVRPLFLLLSLSPTQTVHKNQT